VEAAKDVVAFHDTFFLRRACALLRASRAKNALRRCSARRVRSAGSSTPSGSASRSKRPRNAARAGAVSSRLSCVAWRLCAAKRALRLRSAAMANGRPPGVSNRGHTVRALVAPPSSRPGRATQVFQVQRSAQRCTSWWMRRFCQSASTGGGVESARPAGGAQDANQSREPLEARRRAQVRRRQIGWRPCVLGPVASPTQLAADLFAADRSWDVLCSEERPQHPLLEEHLAKHGLTFPAAQVERTAHVHAFRVVPPGRREIIFPAQSRSPGLNRRCAWRARASAVDAAYRLSIVRDRQPTRRIRSCSLPPLLSHA
jgi:hypothetical protein